MSKWLLRGLVFAALMVITRLLQAALINAWPMSPGTISILLVSVFALAVLVWAVLDGRADARANPNPDRRGDLSMRWLLAGLFAGVVSGAVTWFIGLFYASLYVGGLVSEVTTFAAFTALVMFLTAVVGAAAGRLSVDRRAGEDTPSENARADTDVFAAVRSDSAEPAAAEGTATEAQTSAVAVVEHDEAADPDSARPAGQRDD